MALETPRPVLKGKKALVVGIANEHSIAYGCAKAFAELGADLAVTYLNEKAKPHVQPLAEQVGAQIFAPLDVSQPGQLELQRHHLLAHRLELLLRPRRRLARRPQVRGLEVGQRVRAVGGGELAQQVLAHPGGLLEHHLAQLVLDGGRRLVALARARPKRRNTGAGDRLAD